MFQLFCQITTPFGVVREMHFLPSSTDFSSLGHVLPPKDQVVKYILLDGSGVNGRGHEKKDQAYIVVHRPTTSKNNVRAANKPNSVGAARVHSALGKFLLNAMGRY